MRLVRNHVPVLVVAVFFGAAVSAQASVTPVGPLPAGPVSSTTTETGQLVAIALPHTRQGDGYSWRIARRFDSHVVREISEADVGTNTVLVFDVVGRGDTALVFALTRGDSSGKALKAYTQRVHARG
jgi:hypothetical protein